MNAFINGWHFHTDPDHARLLFGWPKEGRPLRNLLMLDGMLELMRVYLALEPAAAAGVGWKPATFVSKTDSSQAA
jgi:hypothetical protein